MALWVELSDCILLNFLKHGACLHGHLKVTVDEEQRLRPALLLLLLHPFSLEHVLQTLVDDLRERGRCLEPQTAFFILSTLHGLKQL